MRQRRVWTEDRLALFVEYRKAGLSNSEIVERLGGSLVSLKNALRHLPDLPRHCQWWDQSRTRAFVDLRNEGLPNSEIAAKLGFGLSAISRALSRLPDLPRRVRIRPQYSSPPPRYLVHRPKWSDARIAELEEALNEIPRLSYTAIGKRCGCTKNAIAGAVYRHCEKAQTPVPAAIYELPPAKCCAWPFGDPGSPGFRYCGAPTVDLGSSYCERHRAVAYVKPVPREKRAA